MATRNTGNARRYEVVKTTVTTTNGVESGRTTTTYTMLPANNGKLNPGTYAPISEATLKTMSTYDYKGKLAEFLNAISNIPNSADLYNTGEQPSNSCPV